MGAELVHSLGRAGFSHHSRALNRDFSGVGRKDGCWVGGAIKLLVIEYFHGQLSNAR